MGFIPPQRLLAILLWEHEEDMTRLGGFLRETAAARTASLEAVVRRFWHRIPWLLVGLLGALAAADIVGAFEAQLQETVALAFFIPGIVYMADAVGTQTETLVVRGLSVGVSIGQIVRREALTGLLIGITLSWAFFPLALWRWGDGRVAMVVALSLLLACSTATFVALALPWLFHRFGKDPAFGTGPLATVIQDLLSIMIYFIIAALVV
jgi:magnesium transporter